MFDSVSGRLEIKEPTRAVVVAGGVGLQIHVPLSTYEGLPARNEEARLLLHLVVRDEEWKLFGFLTEAERDVFRALLRVSGVGPMIALALLSGLPPKDLADAVSSGDVKVLTRVKGVGRKTAERIVVELRDVLAVETGEGGVPTGPIESENVRDAVAALIALGMDPAEARRRAEKVAGKDDDASVTEVVRAALRG